MKNLIIHTYDIISYNGNMNRKHDLLYQCRRAATKYNVDARVTYSSYPLWSDKDIYLELTGCKSGMIKYYLRTFFVGNESFKSAAKRLWDIATTH